MEWWEIFFDENWGRLGFEPIEQEKTERETDFIVNALDLKKNERVLDLACGVGRHSLELARRGYKHVVGLDFTQAYLKQAIVKAKHEGLNVGFVRGDMRDIPFEDELDTIFNFFTSFGYFEKREDDERTIESIARALKKGGRFLIDLINRDWIIRNFAKRGWSEYEGEFILRDLSFDLATSTQHGSWTFVTENTISKRKMQLRMYSLHEMIDLFERNGLEFCQAWGNIEKEPLTWNHNRLIVLAKKQ